MLNPTFSGGSGSGDGADLGPVNARIDDVEQRLAALEPGETVDEDVVILVGAPSTPTLADAVSAALPFAGRMARGRTVTVSIPAGDWVIDHPIRIVGVHFPELRILGVKGDPVQFNDYSMLSVVRNAAAEVGTESSKAYDATFGFYGAAPEVGAVVGFEAYLSTYQMSLDPAIACMLLGGHEVVAVDGQQVTLRIWVDAYNEVLDADALDTPVNFQSVGLSYGSLYPYASNLDFTEAENDFEGERAALVLDGSTIGAVGDFAVRLRATEYRRAVALRLLNGAEIKDGLTSNGRADVAVLGVDDHGRRNCLGIALGAKCSARFGRLFGGAVASFLDAFESRVSADVTCASTMGSMTVTAHDAYLRLGSGSLVSGASAGAYASDWAKIRLNGLIIGAGADATAYSGAEILMQQGPGHRYPNTSPPIGYPGNGGASIHTL